MLPPRLGWGGRLLALALALACLALLLTAAWVRPDAAGIGTHQQLGLAACGFEQRTRLPCPTCGMTTSFAWFVRGRLAASLYVQPMGTALALLAAATVWAGGWVALTGRPVYRLLRVLPPSAYFIPLFAGLVAAWAWKILIHVRGWDGTNG